MEYFYLLEIISNYARSPLGRDYCLSLRPVSDLDEIRQRLDLLAEVREFLNVKGWSFEGDVGPVDTYLNKVRIKASYLACDEILRIKRLLDVAFGIKKFVLSEGKEYKRLYSLVQQIPDLRDLLTLFKRSISDTGKIKDSASLRLKRIREKKAHYRNYLQKRLQELLAGLGINDFHISIRDGRYVVGLNSNKRGKIKGIFHGYSHSKATSFIEPADVVDENNRIAELEAEEKEEEARVLIAITKEIAREKDQIEYTQFLLGKIDAIYAQARFCDLISCVRPEICEDDVIDIDSAKNPILGYLSSSRGGDCVPVDLRLNREKNVLIISGPNRGGKTVALKTLGLLCLMAQTGLHIPAKEGSRLRIFKRIIAEIGDDQDIQSGMSTFSAHIQHLKEIIENADEDTLVIIDEPGMGTDPLEGASLSMAILDHLIKKGAFVAISTHLNKLKLYGINNKKVMNASVEFDLEKRAPTYRLKYGSAGVSMGFEIAKEMGIPDSILMKARDYLDDNGVQVNRSIERLNELVSQLNDERDELQRIKREYDDLYQRIKKEKEQILDTARIEAESLIRNAREELREAIRRFKKRREVSPNEVINKVSNITRELTSRFTPSKDDSGDTPRTLFREGQGIYHKGLKKKGVVISSDPEKKSAFILLGNMRLWTNFNDIEPLEEGSGSDDKQGQDQSVLEISKENESTFMLEINLVGYRVDEAIPVIDKAIDRAILSGSPGFKIIHGIGTGKLRKAVREYLKSIPQVKSVRKADTRFGGDSITIVELR